MPQLTVPFETGSDVVLTGFDPVEYNGNHTVLQATQSSIRIADPLSTPVRNIKITGYSKTNTLVTFTFGNYGSVPFAVGSKIFLTGFTPTSYNQQYLVTDCTSTSVTVEQSDPQDVSRFGIISNVKNGTATNTPTTIYYALIAGQLPDGVQIQQTGILAGVPQAAINVQGVPAEVGRDVISKFAVRAYTQKVVDSVVEVDRLADRTFELTVTGQDAPEFISPAGQLAQYYDGGVVQGLQVLYTDTDPDQIVTIKLIAGQLPPGLSISKFGLISGFIPVTVEPLGTGWYDATGEAWDQFPYNFSSRADSTNYEFVLEISDGFSSNLRTFSIFVWSRSAMTADNDEITADNTFITADVSPVRAPIILNNPGSIGIVRNDNFYAYQFNGVDLDGEPFTIFPIVTIGTVSNVNVNPPGDPQTVLNSLFPSAEAGSAVTDLTLDQVWVYDGTIWDNFGFLGIDYASALPVGLTLDPVSGWLYGFLPNTGITSNTYDFSLLIKKTSNANIFSGPYNYSLTVNGPISSEVIWLTPNDPVELARVPSNLGSLVNGSTSTLFVKAENIGGLELQYELDLGTMADPMFNSLPQGLTLLPSGEIAGRVSFNTFALDGGTTTFDVTRQNGAKPTTFDLTFVFTVRVFSVNGIVNVTKAFSITVVRRFNQPYENLYIQCMPPQEDRDLINSLLQNSDIFPQELLYRSDDANFGLAKNVIYHHAFGLSAATIEDYYSSLLENHYWKNLILGEIKTAQARDSSGNVIYEVVYSQIVDNLVNNQDQSVDKVVQLPYPVDYGNDLVDVTSVTPNSLINMRDQVIDTVGQISNILPTWMISPQQNGRVLGFVPAWVIAYTKPRQAEKIAYYIRTQFGQQLNLIDFEVDRYELDRLLTKHWDPATDSWIPTPPEYTTFDTSGESVSWENNSSSLIEWLNEDNQAITWTTGVGSGLGTIFDQNSMQFTAPVDMYSNTQEYDKYLVFPKRNILE